MAVTVPRVRGYYIFRQVIQGAFASVSVFFCPFGPSLKLLPLKAFIFSLARSSLSLAMMLLSVVAMVASLLAPVCAHVALPALFTDNMVLEAREALDLRPFVFGTAAPYEQVQHREPKGRICVYACVCAHVYVTKECRGNGRASGWMNRWR